MAEELPRVEIATKVTTRSVEETVARLIGIISTRALTLFAVIDQSQQARSVGQDLRETVLVIFGDPRMHTQVMVDSPLAALDLPLRVLVWSDGGQTNVSYETPRSLTSRLKLRGDLATRLGGSDALTDALVAPL
jgi:uncharacterized protein (DUF302 family)